jgi:hypothetical protein
MSKYTTTKFVEAVMLNKNTGMPTSKRIDLPFGAVILDPVEDDNFLRFVYLGESYHVRLADIQGYYHPIGGPAAAASDKAESSEKPAPGPRSLEFLPLKSNLAAKRAKVPGGWLVAVGDGLAFLPDPGHKWDGSSS